MTLIKSLFTQQKEYIDFFFDHVDPLQAERFFEICLQTQGLLIFTGVGKSGIIAEKIALTLISTGTKALYLPPMNFLHGDIGIVTSNDTIVMLSKSGGTEELLNLVPYFKKRGAKLLSMVSNQESRLAKQSDCFIHLPVKQELCPLDLAPTTSTAVQLLFGDILTAALMRAKNFSVDDYISNHPLGAIGKKMTLKVKDLMKKQLDIPLCGPKDMLMDVLVELSNKKCGCLLVVNEGQELQGIFTDGDLRRALQGSGSRVLEKKMEELMNMCPIAIEQETLAWDAIKLMQKDPKRWVMVTPVIEQKKVVGILRMHDIIQAGI